MAEEGWLSRFWAQRRRWSLLVLVCGVLVVGIQLLEVMPVDTRIEYRLGPRHRSVEAVTIRYLTENEEAKGVRFEWQDGAPERIPHTVELYPGRYVIRATLREGGRDRDIERRLDVPAEGTVRIDLFNVAHASLRWDSVGRETLRGEAL